MVRALPLETVRQQQHHTGLLVPLRLPGHDELVGDDLGAVGEVSELRLPQHQGVRPGHRVAVFETHGRVLAEQRVVDIEGGLVVAQVFQGHPGLVGDAVDDGREPLREGPTARILPGQPDGPPLHQQRTDGEQLGRRPVDGAVEDLIGPAFQLGQHLRMWGETLREGGVHLADPVQHLRCDLGEPVPLLRRIVGHPRVLLDHRVGVLGVTGLLEHVLQTGPELVHHVLGVGHGDVAAPDQGLGVQAPDGAFLFDQVVHLGLRETRIITLVVAAAPVADQIDHDVLVEPLPVGEGETRSPDT